MKIDYTFFDRMLNHDPALPAVPLYEHGVDYPVIRAIMGYADDPDLSTKEGLLTFWKRWIDFYDQMGYPCVSVEMSAFFPQIAMKAGRSEGDEVTRGYVDENEGVIKGWEDLENPDLWTPVEECFPFDLYAEVLAMVPPHMKAVGGCSGGPFENATFLMGLTPFCLNLYEDEALVEALLQKVGERLVYAADRLCGLEKLGVYRFGDDLGFKNATMISPEALRKYIFPWQKRWWRPSTATAKSSCCTAAASWSRSWMTSSTRWASTPNTPSRTSSCRSPKPSGGGGTASPCWAGWTWTSCAGPSPRPSASGRWKF